MSSSPKKIELATEMPKFRNFDWEKAKSFYYITKCGSFANAARFLNISQSALSRQILHLEYHLGCPLFIRHSDGIKLTRKGEEIFAVAEMAFIGFKGATQDTRATTANGKKRKIKISTTHAVAAYILSPLIFDYNKEHPDIVFELITDDHLIDLVLNDVDIAIRPYDVEAREQQQDYLFSLEKKLYTSPQYIEKHGEPKTLEELKDHHLIAFGHPEVHPYADVNWILRLGMPSGKLHEPSFTSNSVECMIEAMKNGMGIIGSYEEFNILKHPHVKNILPEVRDKKIQWYYIYPNYLKNDTEVMQLKSYLQNYLPA